MKLLTLLFALQFCSAQDTPPERINTWIEDLNDDSVEVREKASQALFDNFSKARAQMELKLLDRPNAEVKGRLQRLLYEGKRDPRARALEKELSVFLRNNYPEIADDVYSGDLNLVSSALTAPSQLHRYGIVPLRDVSLVRLAAAKDLSRRFEDWRMLDKSLKSQLVHALLAEEPVPETEKPLKSLLDDSDPEMRDHSLSILSQFKPSPVWLEDKIGAMLEDPEVDVILSAILALQVMKSKKHLLKLEEYSLHREGRIRHGCLSYWIEVYPQEEKALKYVLDSLTDKDAGIALLALDTLEEWKMVQKYRPFIEKLLADPQASYVTQKARRLLEELDTVDK